LAELKSTAPQQPTSVNGERVRLLAPFERVEVTCDASPSEVYYSAFGYPEELVAAGAIEPEMALRGGPGKRCVDSHGNRFIRAYNAKYGVNAGKVRIERRLRSLALARSLPGVPSDFTVDPFNRLEACPGAIVSCPLWWSQEHTIWIGAPRTLLDRELVTAVELDDLARAGPCDSWLWRDNGRMIHRLLDGYVGVTDPRIEHNPDAMRRRGIRLVVDNTRRPDPPHG